MSEPLEGAVKDLSRFGEGIVRTEQGSVFAPGVLPGERVALTGVRKHGKVLRADRARVIDASGQRVAPACPIAGRCGGCPLMIASATLQEKFRRGLVAQAIEGLPGADAISLEWIGSPESLGYRLRARLRWDHTARGLRFGYRAPRSEQLAEIRSCAVLHPTLDRAQAAIRKACGDHFQGRGELHLAMGEGGAPVAALRSDDAQPPGLYAAIEGLVKGGALTGAALRVGGATVDATFGDPREVRQGADGEPLIGTVAGFSQANDALNRALVERVVALARPAQRHVLELFAGAGNLTVMLARGAQSLLAVERDEDAAAACRENLRRRGLEVTVRTDDAETYRAKERPDVVVLDPPRTGAPGAITRLHKLGVPEIVYVSCDPPTLGRDLRTLAQHGYVLRDVVALDMFPQTAHVETIARLARG